jgi:hypothetical protein
VGSATWSDLTHVAAFSIGVVAGAVIVLRLARVLLELMRHERDRRDDHQEPTSDAT